MTTTTPAQNEKKKTTAQPDKNTPLKKQKENQTNNNTTNDAAVASIARRREQMVETFGYGSAPQPLVERRPTYGWYLPEGATLNYNAFRNETANDEDNNSRDYDDEALEDENFLGTLSSKIVGVQYYKGAINVNETVSIIHEPTNRYDKNALRVDNQARVQIGHLPKRPAATLAPLISSGRIRIEGTVTEGRNQYIIPLRVALFCRKGDELSLQKELKERRAGVAFAKMGTRKGKEVAAEKAAADRAWEDLVGQGRQIDRRTGERVLEKFGLEEEDIARLGRAPQSPRIKSTLLSHQLQGIHWMVSREHPPKPTEDRASQFWSIRKSAGRDVYHNAATEFTTSTPPSLARGGILADEMGLGKTLSVLALLTYDPTGKGVIEDKLCSNTLDESFAKTSLVVAPLSVIGNWTQQIQEHIDTSEKPFTFIVYHGGDRDTDAKKLAGYDLVITTYNIVTNDRPSPGSTAKKGLFAVKWRRVILDEGHLIKNKKTKMSESVCALTSERHWVLSGTPIQNSISDLYSITRFLRFAPLDQFDYWTRLIARPLRNLDPIGTQRLRTLLRAVCLRRTKTMKIDGEPIVKLPAVTTYIHNVELDPAEREAYDALETETRSIFETYANEDAAVVRNYSSILELLLRLRQLCNHRALCGHGRVERALEAAKKVIIAAESSSLAKGKEAAENMTTALGKEAVDRLLDILAQSFGDDCCVCLDTMTRPVVTPCGHFFCKACIEGVIARNPVCPMCRAGIENGKLLEKPPPSNDDDDEGREGDITESPADESVVDPKTRPSSKIAALIKFVLASNKKDPDVKSVVFSQWTSMLDLVERHFKDNGVRTARFDGRMSRKARDAAVASFNDLPSASSSSSAPVPSSSSSSPSPNVLLVSLKCGALGLNLTRASQVFILDPWWNPSVEDQATDRVNRIGQTRPVSCVRFVAKGTVEERVVELQERKRELAREAFGGDGGVEGAGAGGRGVGTGRRDAEKARERRVEELRCLVGGGGGVGNGGTGGGGGGGGSGGAAAAAAAAAADGKRIAKGKGKVKEKAIPKRKKLGDGVVDAPPVASTSTSNSNSTSKKVAKEKTDGKRGRADDDGGHDGVVGDAPVISPSSLTSSSTSTSNSKKVAKVKAGGKRARAVDDAVVDPPSASNSTLTPTPTLRRSKRNAR